MKVPWSARLVPASCRDAVVGDALEEASRRAGEARWRVRLWLERYVITAALAAHRQLAWERLRNRSNRGRRLTMGTFTSDVRCAVHSLKRSPAFLAMALAMLALGMGGVTAMYSVLYGALIRPLEYEHAGALVVLQTSRLDEVYPAVSKPDLEDLRESARVLEEIGAWQPWRVTLMSPGQEPTRVSGASVDARYFHLLGIRPALGRTFGPADDVPGHADVVLLSDALWRTAYGGDPGVIGGSIELEGRLYTIIGVQPRDFRDPMAATAFSTAPVLWRSSPPDFQTTNRSWRSFRALGRLAPGSTIESARVELADLSAKLAETWPATNTDVRMSVLPMREHLVGASRRALGILGAAVLLVLLVACANVANLLLARGIARTEEHRLRRALGARRLQVIRPLLVENGLLAVAGLGPGMLVALGLTRLFAPWTRDLSMLVDIHVDGPVLLGSAVLSLVAVLGFGLAPAWQATGSDGRPGSGPRSVSGPGARLRSGLVVVEMTLAVMLLAGAGLLLRSYRELNAVDLGLRTEGVVVATITPAITRYADAAGLDRVIDDVIERARRVPGVRAAGIVSDLPLTGVSNSGWIRRSDRVQVAGETPPSALYRTVAGDYFAAAGIERVAGRSFDGRDHADAPPVIVINEATSAALFPDEPALGRSVSSMGWTREVVGVVRNVREAGPDAPAPMAVYVPYAQETQEWAVRTTTLLASVRGDPRVAAPAIRQAILDVDPTTAINGVRTMADVAARATSAARFRTALLTAFACVALALAALGLGTVVTFHVTQRRRELGLRVALGATDTQLVAMIVRQGVGLAAIGAAVGILFALILGRLLGHLLFGVGPADPVVMLTVPLVLLAAATVAALLPALRVARLYPAGALRGE